MKDESVAVAGKLAGRWRFSCIECGKDHVRETTIQRCSHRFARAILQGRLRLGSHEMFSIGNEFEAAKKGILERYHEVEGIVSQVDPEDFELPAELFCRVETQTEAAELVLTELKNFVSRRTKTFDPIFRIVRKFHRELAAAPTIRLGKRVEIRPGSTGNAAGSQVVVVDGVELDTTSILAYYGARLRNREARRILYLDFLTLLFIDVDGDRLVLERHNRGFIGVKPGVGEGLMGYRTQTLEELRDWGVFIGQ